ncbi:glycosyltransferase family 4 protein [Nocardioides jejuensis]|uniref:Glycosyl transferase n=1 Tax=Nocardioides jejuensis TaxID=2502782 RepID=A0A4R1CII2_9ACTN|nr:glycosyl transferase [Nocardioides jejuensis]TCJ30215.1 glycosyl transferase [Nocardioides jejuensis]
MGETIGAAEAVTVAAVAALVTCVLVPVFLPVLRRFAIDAPIARSSHVVPVPRGGGLAVVAGIVAAVATAEWIGSVGAAWYVLGGMLVLGALGLADDVRSLPGPLRLLVQVGTALGLTALFDVPGTGWTAILGSLLFVGFLVGYVNAFNFMDGINGVSSFSAVVAGTWYGVIGVRGDHLGLAVLGVAVAGAAFGFMPWNAVRAKVFLGDVGSYALGGAIAVLALLAWAIQVGVLVAVAPLVIYVVDTAWVLVKRTRGHRPLMDGHREHVYQRVLDRTGWPHWVVALLVAGATGLCCAGVSVGVFTRQPAITAAGLVLGVTAYQFAPRLVPARRP